MSIHIDRYYSLLKKRSPKARDYNRNCCAVEAHIQFAKEQTMSPRQMKSYWEEPSMDVSPACCYSRFLKHTVPLWSKLLRRNRAKHI